MNDEQMRELFSEMREDAIPAESLARVRMAVTGRVEARRRRVGMSWKFATACAVCGCLAAVMWRPKTVEPMTPVIAVEQPAPVEAPEPIPTRVRPVVHQPLVHKKARPVPMEGGASEIRIESPLEPDVVIVLIGG